MCPVECHVFVVQHSFGCHKQKIANPTSVSGQDGQSNSVGSGSAADSPHHDSEKKERHFNAKLKKKNSVKLLKT